MTQPIDNGTLWELHLAVARSMRSARVHALARKLIEKSMR